MKNFTSRSSARFQRSSKPQQFTFPKSWRMVVGNHSIAEALHTHKKNIKQAWFRQNWESSQELREFEKEIRAAQITIEIKSPQALDQLANSNQGLILFIDGKPEFNLEKLKNLSRGVILALDGIEDPHNFGAILRTSWLSGVSGIIIPQDRAVHLTSTVHKVACGGVEHVPVLEVNNFNSVFSELKESGYWVFGLGHKGNQTLFDLKLPEKIIWVIGNEESGMRKTTEKFCDEIVSIPQLNRNASYNASVAAGMTLMETMRQQSEKN